jgi:hypothetical protein
MPVGIGGLITEGFGGNLNPQVAQLLAHQGYSPNPNPDPAAQGASSAMTPAPGQTPSQSYAPDPQNAKAIELLLRVHQQDALSSDLNQHLAGMAASFGTAQQQADKQAAVRGMGGIQDDRLAALKEIGGIQKQQTDINEHAQFLAGADLLGQQMLGLKPGQGRMLGLSGQLPDMIATHLREVAEAGRPTDAIKDYNAARQALRDQGVSEEEINNRIPPDMLVSAIGGQTPVEKDLRNDIRMWKMQHPGGTDEQMYAEHPGWTSTTGYTAEKTEETKTAALAAHDKLTSKDDLDEAQRAARPVQDTINYLKNVDPAKLADAVRNPEMTGGTGGKLRDWTGTIDPETLQARIKLDQLQSQLAGEGLRNVKNVRNSREFQALASGASSIFNRNQTSEGITREINRLDDGFNLSLANSTAAAGGEVPAEYADRVNRAYLKKGDPLYNGATVEKYEDFSKMSEADADAAVAALPDGAKFRGPDGNIHKKGKK